MSRCLTETDFSFAGYKNYTTAPLTVAAYNGTVDAWNAGMDVYKTSQSHWA